jgi:DNA polymerase-3 subunit beta
MIDKTAFAASKDESRGIITGVLLELQDGDLNMVAIDGYRISITRRPMPEAKTYSIIIHARILGELSRIISEIDDEESSCMLYLAEKRAVFSFSGVRAELKLMDGQFIPYQDILPGSSKITIDVNRKQLMESIDRASLLARSGKNNLVKFEISENTMTVTSDSEEGTVREDIIVNKSGDDLMIGFNANYMMDVLKVIDEDEIHILFNSSIDPCLLKSFDGNEYEYLVLPVRI